MWELLGPSRFIGAEEYPMRGEHRPDADFRGLALWAVMFGVSAALVYGAAIWLITLRLERAQFKVLDGIAALGLWWGYMRVSNDV